MSLLPLLNQFIVPTAISMYTIIVSLFLYTPIHPKVHHSAGAPIEKKVLTASKNPIPTDSPNKSYSIGSKQNDATTSEHVNNESTHSNKPSPIPTTTSNTDITPTPTTTSQQIASHIVTATTTLSAGGKTIHLAMKYPSLGGNMSGTISGDCNGTITGIYEGPTTQHLSGKGSATCPMGFINIPVDITYSGTLTSSTNAHIQYTVTALGKTESGSSDLTLSE